MSAVDVDHRRPKKEEEEEEELFCVFQVCNFQLLAGSNEVNVCLYCMFPEHMPNVLARPVLLFLTHTNNTYYLAGICYNNKGVIKSSSRHQWPQLQLLLSYH